MSVGAEIVRSIVGAVRIALLDPAASAWFNLTLQGFRRSFLAPLLLAPFFLLIVLLEAAGAEETADPGALAVMRVLSYGLGVVAFPLLMIPIAKAFQLTDAYVRYIILWNWSSVPLSLVTLPVMAIFAFDLAGGRTAAMLSMTTVISVLFYGYLVAREGLRCPPLMAGVVAMTDFVLTLAVSSLPQRMAG